MKRVSVFLVLTFFLLLITESIVEAQSTIEFVNSYDVRIYAQKKEGCYLGEENKTPLDVCFDSSGKKMFVVDGSDKIFQYNLQFPYALDSVNKEENHFELIYNKGFTHIVGMSFDKTGQMLYLVGEKDFLAPGLHYSGIFQYQLKTPFDVSSADTMPVSIFHFDGYISIPQSVVFSAEGEFMYVTDRLIGDIKQYRLKEPFMIQMAEFLQKTNVLNQSVFPSDVCFDPSGKKMFVSSGTNRLFNEVIVQFELNHPYDISSTHLVYQLNIKDKIKQPFNGLSFAANGRQLFVVDNQNNEVVRIDFITDFIEIEESDTGRVVGQIPLVLETGKFSSREIKNKTHFEVLNLPEGLEPELKIHKDLKSGLITLKGQARYHSENDSTEKLKFRFNPSAFSEIEKQEVVSHSKIYFKGVAPSIIYAVVEFVLWLCITVYFLISLFFLNQSIKTKYITLVIGLILFISYDFYVSSTVGVEALGKYAYLFRVAIIIELCVFVWIVARQARTLTAQNNEMKDRITSYIKEITDLKEEVDGTKFFQDLMVNKNLSTREIDVLKEIVDGKTNKEIGNELFISSNTVKFHIKNIYEKLEISSRREVMEQYMNTKSSV